MKKWYEHACRGCFWCRIRFWGQIKHICPRMHVFRSDVRALMQIFVNCATNTCWLADELWRSSVRSLRSLKKNGMFNSFAVSRGASLRFSFIARNADTEEMVASTEQIASKKRTCCAAACKEACRSRCRCSVATRRSSWKKQTEIWNRIRVTCASTRFRETPLVDSWSTFLTRTSTPRSSDLKSVDGRYSTRLYIKKLRVSVPLRTLLCKQVRCSKYD